jgi:hypothetical protein
LWAGKSAGKVAAEVPHRGKQKKKKKKKKKKKAVT